MNAVHAVLEHADPLHKLALTGPLTPPERWTSEFLGALRGPEQVTSATTVEKTEMGGTANALRTGAFAVGPHTAVFTIADSILWLSQAPDNNSIVRKLQVVKVRGQAQMPGLHTFRITGDLTIKGVTRPVTLDFTATGLAQDPFGNLRAGFEGTTTINRKDWGLEWNAALETGGVLVSEKIKLVFDISAIKAA